MALTYLLNKIKSQKAYFLGIPIPMYFALLVLTILALFLGVRRWNNRGEWDTLVNDRYGFSIDYPVNWEHSIYGERGYHNALDLKALIATHAWGSFGSVTKKLEIYWMPLEEPTLFRASQWGAEKLAQHNIIATDLQETQIGIGNYPALTRTFQHADSSKVWIHYYVIRNGDTYLLEFYLSHESDQEEALPIFARILASFNLFD